MPWGPTAGLAHRLPHYRIGSPAEHGLGEFCALVNVNPCGSRLGDVGHPIGDPLEPTTDRGLLLRDLRDPAAPMAPVSVKLPLPMVAELDRRAAEHHTSRAVLLRSLVVDALERIDAAQEVQA